MRFVHACSDAVIATTFIQQVMLGHARVDPKTYSVNILWIKSAADIHLNLPQPADKALFPPLWIPLLLFLCSSR